ncbi:hypothetical protein MTO96_025186 [Rhipicephalus appendiculatus]
MAYMDVMCSHLLGMSAEELQYLDDHSALDLPKIRGKPVPDAVRQIRSILMRRASVPRHLEFIACIYGFLEERGVIRPWVLYSMDQRVSPATAVGDVLSTLPRCRVGRYTKTTPSFSCTCLVASDEVGWMVYSPCFFCIWPWSSCVAIHQPSPGKSLLVTGALERLLGEHPESSCCGIYQDLSKAHDAARRMMQ